MMNPLTPSWTSSSIPGVVATIGTQPHAMASLTTLGSRSSSLADMNKNALARCISANTA